MKVVDEVLYALKGLRKGLGDKEARLYFQRLITIIADKIGATLPYSLDTEVKKTIN